MKKFFTPIMGLLLLGGCSSGKAPEFVNKFSHLPDSVYHKLCHSVNKVNEALFEQDNVVVFLSSGYMTVRDGVWMQISDYYGKRVPNAMFRSIKPVYKVGEGGHPNVVYSTDVFLCDGDIGFLDNGNFTLTDISMERPEGYYDGNDFNRTLDGNVLFTASMDVMSVTALFNRQGECLIPWSQYIVELAEGVYGVENDGQMTLAGANGKPLSDTVWDRLDKFAGNLIWARQTDGFIGLLDTKGAVVVPFEYTSLSQGDGLHSAVKNDKMGYLDDSHVFNEVTGYDKLGDFIGQYAEVFKDGKRGFIDKQFKQVLPCEYGQGNWRTDIYFHAFETGNHVVYDFSGKEVYKAEAGVDGYSSLIKGGCFIPVFRNEQNGYEKVILSNGRQKGIDGVFNYMYKDKFYGDTVYIMKVSEYKDGETVTGMDYKPGNMDDLEDIDNIRYIPEFDALLLSYQNHHMLQVRGLIHNGIGGYVAGLRHKEKAKMWYGKELYKMSDEINKYLNQRCEGIYTKVHMDDYSFKAEQLGVYTFQAHATDLYNGYECILDVTLYDNGTEFTRDLILRKHYVGQKYYEDEKNGTLNLRPSARPVESGYPSVEFGVEEDVWAYLYSNSFVSNSGTTLNFVKGCLYMDGQRVSGILRVTLRDGDYSTAMLEGSNVWMWVNGARNEIQNKADGRIYKRK